MSNVSNDLVSGVLNLEYDAENNRIELTCELSPNDPAVVQMYRLGMVIREGSLVYAFSNTGLSSNTEDASGGTWSASSYAGNIGESDQDRTFNGLVQGSVFRDGEAEDFTFGISLTIEAATLAA